MLILFCFLIRKRDDLAESLKLAKLRPIMPEGGFFIMADTSAHGDEVIDEKYRSQV
jgi:hypothetical protein